MKQEQGRAVETGIRRVFLAGLWTALLTALLSALLPLGMPQSTALGSAFNPAATAVAIKAGSGQLRIVAKAAAKDDDTAPRDGPSWPAVCGASTPRFNPSPAFSGACRRFSDPTARGAEIWPAIYARGPPTA